MKLTVTTLEKYHCSANKLPLVTSHHVCLSTGCNLSSGNTD
uniref:Uncharacterized protein n=1 Tax=Anguilla anguilla TaxID=7936 RepID=A0A0E9WKA1_ANGAN